MAVVAAWIRPVLQRRDLREANLALGRLQREEELLVRRLDRALCSKDSHLSTRELPGVIPQSDIDEDVAQWRGLRSRREDRADAADE